MKRALLLLALALAPDPAGAVPGPLDPTRLAGDFAPMPEFEVVPFEVEPEPFDAGLPGTDSSLALPETTAVPLPAGPVLTSTLVESEAGSGLAAPLAGALVGGALGLFAGGYGGMVIAAADDYVYETEAIGAAMLGGAVGEIFLLPLGAHVANGSRGSYGSALAGSVLGAAATVGLGALHPAGAVTGLMIQLYLAARGEQNAANRKERHRAAMEAAGAEP